VVNIHKSFGNADWLHHHRWVILDEIKRGGLAKGGDGGDRFMIVFFQWQQLSQVVPPPIPIFSFDVIVKILTMSNFTMFCKL
jgi:hypothetical protein